jgi:hypothetical protein
MTQIIALFASPLAKIAVIALIAAGAWFHGNGVGKDSEAAKWADANAKATEQMIRKHNDEMDAALKLVAKDRESAEKYAKERDEAKAESSKLGAKLKEAMANKPVYVECKAEKPVVDIINDLIRSQK